MIRGSFARPAEVDFFNVERVGQAEKATDVVGIVNVFQDKIERTSFNLFSFFFYFFRICFPQLPRVEFHGLIIQNLHSHSEPKARLRVNTPDGRVRVVSLIL